MSVRVTEDEVDKRAKEIIELRKRGATIDASSIKGGAKDKRYKWVNRRAREGERINHFTDAGYEPVKAAKEGEKGARHSGNRKDEAGNIINGDLMLMATPRDNYVDRMAKNKIRADAAEAAFKGARRAEIDHIARSEGHAKRDVTFDDSEQGSEVVLRRRASADNDD